MLVPIAGALLLAAAPAPEAPGRAVAVIVVVPDAVAAGEIQQEMEAAVLPSAPVLAASAMAEALGKSDAVPPDAPDLETRTKELVASGQAAYYADRTADAVRDLSAARALLDRRVRVSAGERASVLLALVAARLAAQDRAGALEDARRALSYDASLKVDPDAYPPSVVAIVDEAKAAQPTRHQVTLSRLPPGAAIRVDGTPAGGTRFATGPGRHWLEVSAPGCRTVERAIDVVSDVTVAVPLAADVRPAVAQGLRSIAVRGEANEAEERQLSALAAKLGADAIAVVAADTAGLRPVVWSFGATTFGPAAPPGTAGARRVASWIASAVRGAIGAAGAPGAIHLVSDIVGARVAVDGKPAGVTPLTGPLSLPPGPHAILITAAGYEPVARAVEVRSGETDRLDLALVRAPPPPPPPLLKRPLFWLATAGALALGGGGAAYAADQSRRTVTEDKRTSTVVLEY